MTADRTQPQSSESRQRSQQLSRQPTGPPGETLGYEAREFLGSGAFGEVWVGVDLNTGRRVAIKFYTHRGGVDWSLLSREVEKLVFLSADRHVVQLLDVGWDAEPPYYVMEYVPNGSLEDYLNRQGPLPVGQAVEIFREVATGLLHAHGKGVLHCDLKPANILLDQDHKPRLADFGQSRLSHEQRPALGTLFFMAPEQADLRAMPDARWDVYALGALLYCTLTGRAPHRHEEALSQIDSASDLAERLERYREFIRQAAPPSAHRQVRGVDRELIEIVDRCLVSDPEERYPNVQSVLDALEARDAVRDRRPLLILGLVGPLLFLLVTALFAARGYHQAVGESNRLLLERALESNGFAADFVSEGVARRIEGYFRTVEAIAGQPEFLQLVTQVVDHPELSGGLRQLANPLSAAEIDPLRQKFVEHPVRAALQQRIDQLLDNPNRPEIASWFVTDRDGTHLASAFDTPAEASPIGRNYAYRTYFHGGPTDRPQPGQRHITATHLSAVFRSTATGAWKVAISTPMQRDGQFLGIVALTVELGRLGDLLGSTQDSRQFNVLVDGRQGLSRGVILQHPLFAKLLEQKQHLAPEFSTDPRYRVPLETWNTHELYRDPLGNHPEGAAYRRDWIAAKRNVRLDPGEWSETTREPGEVDTGLVVLVQENYQQAAAPVFNLGQSLVRQGMLALIAVGLVLFVLWYFVARALRDPNERIRRQGGVKNRPTTLQDMDTIELPQPLRLAKQ